MLDVVNRTVTFSSIPDAIIEQLINDGRVLISSGSFISNDPIIDPYVHHIEGTLDSLEGLPLNLVRSLLEQVGCDEIFDESMAKEIETCSAHSSTFKKLEFALFPAYKLNRLKQEII